MKYIYCIYDPVMQAKHVGNRISAKYSFHDFVRGAFYIVLSDLIYKYLKPY